MPQVAPELYLQIRAFLRNIANACKHCMHKGIGSCDGCEEKLAQSIGNLMDNAPKEIKEMDLSYQHRVEIIIAQMRKAGRPVRANEIDVHDYCSKELKHWTLRQLISLGKVKKEKVGYFHVYSLVTNNEKKENKNGCNKE